METRMTSYYDVIFVHNDWHLVPVSLDRLHNFLNSLIIIISWISPVRLDFTQLYHYLTLLATVEPLYS